MISRRGFLTGILAAAVAPVFIPRGALGILTPTTLSEAGVLTEKMLEDACIAFMQATDERGLLMGQIAKKLIVPPQLFFTACQILEPQWGRVSEGFNALAPMRMGLEVDHYQVDQKAWRIE